MALKHNLIFTESFSDQKVEFGCGQGKGVIMRVIHGNILTANMFMEKHEVIALKYYLTKALKSMDE